MSRTIRKLISIEEDGGIVTVRYTERTYTDADAWLREASSDETASIYDANKWATDCIALRHFPDSPEFPPFSYTYAILDMLFLRGPLREYHLRDLLDLHIAVFNKALNELLTEGIVYRDDTGLHIEQDWLEGYLMDFLSLPAQGLPGATDDHV